MSNLEQVADGVCRLRGDLRGAMNICFVRGPGGELPHRPMPLANRRAALELGGVDRVVAGHAPELIGDDLEDVLIRAADNY